MGLQEVNWSAFGWGVLVVVVGSLLLQAVYRLVARCFRTLLQRPDDLVSDDKSVPRELLEPTNDDDHT